MKITGELFWKMLQKCEGTLAQAGTVTALAIMCLTTVDSSGRYILNRPIIWAYEITENYLMVLTVFLAICYAYRRGSYIRVTFLVDHLPPQMKLFFNYLAQIFCILLSLAFFVATTLKARIIIAGGGTLSVLPIPVGPAYVIIPIAFAFLTLAMVHDLWRAWTQKFQLFKAEDSDSMPE